MPAAAARKQLPTSTTLAPEAVAALPALMTTEQVAELLQLTVDTIRFWRFKNKGPRWIKVGNRHIRYSREDILAWLDAEREAARR